MLADRGSDPNLFRRPAAGELLDGGDVDRAVVEVALHPGKPARHEAAVLADRIAAHRAFAFRNVPPEDFPEDARALFLVDRACKHAVDQTRAAVRGGVPSIHAVHDSFLQEKTHGSVML